MRFASKWLPYALRVLFVCGVWLGILPLATAYLYQGWMYRPKSISSRLSLDLLTGDLVNGGILTVIIILSFLSLMSLADFLRFQWKRDGDVEKEEDETEEVDDSKRLIEPDRFDRFDEEIDSDDGLFVKQDNGLFGFERSIKRQTISVTDEGNPFIPENRNASGIAASNETFLAPNHELNLSPDFALDDLDALTHDQVRELQKRGHYKGVRRQRSLDSCNLRMLHGDDDGDRSDDEESSSHENGRHDPLGETDDIDSETNSDEEDDEAMIERMMQLQEDNLNVQDADNREEEEVEHQAAHDPPEDERFEPRFEPLDRPFEDEPMVSRSRGKRYQVLLLLLYS